MSGCSVRVSCELLLAYEPVARKQTSRAKSRMPAPRFVPIVNAGPQQVIAGVGGTF